MKAEELMIGDWVIVYEKAMPVKARVDGVYGNNAFCLGHPRPVENGFVKYIPLTPEILEKNGFQMAKWQADHTPLPEDTVLFNKGVEEGKRLMMEEAVGAEVWGEVYTSRRIVKSDWLGPEIGNPGDKVRIIIVKED